MNPWDFLDDYRGKEFTGEWPTLPEMFRITVSRFPDNKCFSAYTPEEFRLTYKEALSRINQVAGYLNSIGVKKGDKIGVTGKNIPEWAVAYLSVLFAGAIIVPMDYGLHNDEIESLLDVAGVKFLFCDEEKYGYFRETGKYTMISLTPGNDNYIMDISFPGPINIEEPSEDDLAAILFTSGTTGVSKGVMLTHKNFVSDCYLAQANLTVLSTDVFYALLPLHHSYSMLAVFIESISTGAEVVFARKLAIAQVLKELKMGQVTMFLGIPMLFNKLLKGLMKGVREKGILVYGLIRGLMELSGLIKKIFGVNIGKSLFKGLLSKLSLDTNRICISGGGPLPNSTFRMFNQLGIDFVEGYGLTETAPIVALNPVEAYKVSSVGKILPGMEVKIIDKDEDGNGEVIVKGPNVMKGYYNNEEATKEVFTDDGYLITGDLGYLDSENYLHLTGRKKNLIVTEGGKNVFPEEIEDKFQLFDEIEQILIKGYLIDEKMKTEGIEALIYPVQDDGVDTSDSRLNEIVNQVNKELKSYQKISKVTVLNSPLEMTTTKKIKRHKLDAAG